MLCQYTFWGIFLREIFIIQAIMIAYHLLHQVIIYHSYGDASLFISPPWYLSVVSMVSHWQSIEISVSFQWFHDDIPLRLRWPFNGFSLTNQWNLTDVPLERWERCPTSLPAFPGISSSVWRKRSKQIRNLLSEKKCFAKKPHYPPWFLWNPYLQGVWDEWGFAKNLT